MMDFRHADNPEPFTEARAMRDEARIDRFVQKALSENDGPDEAAIYLAVWIANDAASGTITGRVNTALVEAYRRVRRMADEKAD